MVPIDKVKDIITKHDALEKELSSGSILIQSYLQKNLKNIQILGSIISTAKEYVNFENEKKDLVKYGTR